jgi:hypothetical protein
MSQGTYNAWLSRFANFSTRSNGDYAEWSVSFHSFTHHIHITRFEYAQRQYATGEKHSAQWEQR